MATKPSKKTSVRQLSLSDFPDELPINLRLWAEGYLMMAASLGFAKIHYGNPDAPRRTRSKVFVTDFHHLEPCPLRTWAFWCVTNTVGEELPA